MIMVAFRLFEEQQANPQCPIKHLNCCLRPVNRFLSAVFTVAVRCRAGQQCASAQFRVAFTAI